MRRTGTTTGESVVESLPGQSLLRRREEDSLSKGCFCTPNTQSPLAEMLRMMGISSITSESWSRIVPCRVTHEENACPKLAWLVPPPPLLPPAPSPLAHTHTPDVGQSPAGSPGKEVKPRPVSCYKLCRDPALASCKPRALLVPLPSQHVAPSLPPQALKS